MHLHQRKHRTVAARHQILIKCLCFVWILEASGFPPHTPLTAEPNQCQWFLGGLEVEGITFLSLSLIMGQQSGLSNGIHLSIQAFFWPAYQQLVSAWPIKIGYMLVQWTKHPLTWTGSGACQHPMGFFLTYRRGYLAGMAALYHCNIGNILHGHRQIAMLTDFPIVVELGWRL